MQAEDLKPVRQAGEIFLGAPPATANTSTRTTVSKQTSNDPAVSIYNEEVLVKQQKEAEVMSTSSFLSNTGLAQQSERSRDRRSLSFHNQDQILNMDDKLMTIEKVQHSGGQRGGTQRSPVDHSQKHSSVDLDQTVLADGSDSTLPKHPTKKLCMRKSSDSIFGQRHQSGNEEISSEHENKVDPNAETAWAVGLNATRLADEEEGLLPVDMDQGQYARVRNQILSAWRRNVSQFISKKQAISLSTGSDKAYALAAWRFLHTMGYINFGVSDEINQQMNICHRKKGTVLVVGAGCAGLAAARQLRMLGYQAVVVEGRDRPGGRVHTKRMQGPGTSAVADLGGSIITGIDGNPLAAVVKQQGIHMLDIRTETPLFMSDGIEADYELDQLIEERHNFLLDECSRIRDGMSADASDVSLGSKLEELWKKHVSPYLQEHLRGNKADIHTARKLFDWHLANLEFANASLVPTLSLKFWDQDDPNELLGAHTFVPGGNFRWIKELCRGIPVYYNSEVSQICYGTSGVAVHACGRIFEADAAIVTVPLGVLKRDRILFNPPLTQRKKAAICRLGFGVLNKVIMLFPFAFWSDEFDMFGRVSDTVEGRGEGFLFYSYASISGGALLIGLVAGKAALKYESLTPGQATAQLMDVLRSIYEPRGVNVPAPLEVVCTKWGTDPMCYGAYSSMAVGTGGGKDYDILGESLVGRIYFAGEATTNKYPATMHGAFYSGLQAAANVHANLTKSQGCNGPGWKPLTKESDNLNTQDISALEPSDCLGQSDLVKGAVQEVDQHLQVAAQLHELFKEPDDEVDCFASIHIPVENKLGQKSLLRINPRNKLHGQQRKAPVYIVVETQLALGLMDTSGNDARLALLNLVHDLTFIGRKGLSSDTMALVNDLLQRRNPGMSMHQPVSHQPKLTRELNFEGQLFAASDALAEGAGIQQVGEAFNKFVIPRLGNSAVIIE